MVIKNTDALFSGWNMRWITMMVFLALLTAGALAEPEAVSASPALQVQGQEARQIVEEQFVINESVSRQRLISLELENASLMAALQKLAEEARLGISFQAYTFPNKKVTLNLNNVSVYQALDKLLDGTSLEAVLPSSRDVLVIRKKLDSKIQPETVTGTVTDAESGGTLPGVNILVKGTSMGTSTDQNGEYELQVESLQDTLVFSFMGYQTQEVSINGRTIIDVSLKIQAISGKEMVVVGYGMKEEESLTSAISHVSAEDIVSTKNENVINMLAGKMSGVRVVQSTGEPGDFASDIQIRGFGDPLIIIDGVPRDNMNRLNPNVIESISVLKDASAAIYGVRAGNGVILITTKKGTEGRMNLEYSGYYGFQTPINTPQGLSTAQYMEITNENNIMRGSVEPGTLIYPLETIEDYRSGKKQGTEWWRINSNYYAPQFQQNISASGGTDIINYFVNFGTLQQQGVYSTGDLNYNRYNIRSNVSANINENLKVELLLHGMIDTKNSPYVDTEQYWRSVWVTKPTLPAYANDNRNYMQEIFQGFNPLATTNSDIVGYEEANQKLIQSTANLIWDIPWVKGLQAKGSYSYDYTFWETKFLQKPYRLYQYDLQEDEYRPSMHGNTTIPGTSEIRRSTRFSANTLLQGSLNYKNIFAGKHYVSGLLHYEEGTTNMDNFYALRYIRMTSIEELLGGISEHQIGYMDDSGFQSGVKPANQSGIWEIANKAVVGKVDYSYGSKYYMVFAFRYDGSSKFAPGHQWGFFPSASVGWRISEESFFKNSPLLSFISNLKLRASYGEVGDDGTATFQFVPGYTYPVSNFSWPVRVFDSRAAGIRLKGEPNPNLTWMTSKIYDIGLDADLWGGLFGFEFDWFRRDREGLVGTRINTIPTWLGQGLAQENLNKDATYGLELSLSHRNSITTSIGRLNYGISANVSVSRSEIVSKVRKEDVDQWANWRNNPIGRPKNIWWGVESNGQFQNYEEIFSAPILDGNGNAFIKPGDYSYEDWNGDGVIDDWDNHPLTYGNQAPMVFYGFTLDAQFKGFDLTAVFQGGYMSNVKYSGFLATPFTYEGNGPAFFYDRWHMKNPKADPEDPNTIWIPGTYPTTSQASAALNSNQINSTATIHRADYLRCKSLELGYTVPTSVTEILGIRGVRIFATAYNLFTITPLKYLDPEHPSDAFGALYPLMRTINFGGSINF